MVPRQGGRKSNLMSFFWPGCILGAKGFPWSSQVTSKSIFTWFQRNSETISAEDQTGWPRKKSNRWQFLPQWGRLARTGVNKTMEPLRGGWVGRSPLETNVNMRAAIRYVSAVTSDGCSPQECRSILCEWKMLGNWQSMTTTHRRRWHIEITNACSTSVSVSKV